MRIRGVLLLCLVAFVGIGLGLLIRPQEDAFRPLAKPTPLPGFQVAWFDRIKCLTPEKLGAVRRDPQSSAALFVECGQELDNKLQPLQLSPVQKKAVFFSLLAQALAPYGASLAIELPDLLGEQRLDCDNYAMLTGRLAALSGEVSMAFVGFDGGVVGNHAQIFFRGGDGNDLLLDPTIGLVARVSFNHVLQGKPVSPDHLRVFRQHDDRHIDAFAITVADALLQGRYLPSDLLYYFNSLDEFASFSRRALPLWVASDYDGIIRGFPTPGAVSLRESLELLKAKKSQGSRGATDG